MLTNSDCEHEATLAIESNQQTVIGYHQLAASAARTANAGHDRKTTTIYRGEEARAIFNAVNAHNLIAMRGLTAAEILQVAACVAARVTGVTDMSYFTIMAELRGCYADNSSAFTIQCDTRRALHAVLAYEARDLREAGAIGLSKRAVQALAAECWRNRKGRSPYATVAGFRYAHHSAGNDCMGLMVCNATRADWIAGQEEY